MTIDLLADEHAVCLLEHWAKSHRRLEITHRELRVVRAAAGDLIFRDTNVRGAVELAYRHRLLKDVPSENPLFGRSERSRACIETMDLLEHWLSGDVEQFRIANTMQGHCVLRIDDGSSTVVAVDLPAAAKAMAAIRGGLPVVPKVALPPQKFQEAPEPEGFERIGPYFTDPTHVEAFPLEVLQRVNRFLTIVSRHGWWCELYEGVLIKPLESGAMQFCLSMQAPVEQHRHEWDDGRVSIMESQPYPFVDVSSAFTKEALIADPLGTLTQALEVSSGKQLEWKRRLQEELKARC